VIDVAPRGLAVDAPAAAAVVIPQAAADRVGG
jgi:hypothetical protein